MNCLLQLTVEPYSREYRFSFNLPPNSSSLKYCYPTKLHILVKCKIFNISGGFDFCFYFHKE